ncbi:Undecaprenyl-diphosphatase [Planctomycetes bacterium Poly30]|uniref:Undecaprenyl-diphosphatase n=1 Tax=Saltatorellus ferox TaxID=2528018 RepID=A0A518ERV8_9BACT|nr:Undecaprenyl-diphosphatase [Planctomycetes bacterium Poly30]
MGFLHALGELNLALPLQEAGAAAVEASSASAEVVEPASTAAVFILAVVQGLTEFLPVSSSGHLAIGREVMNLQEGGLALDVALHVGTLLAIVVAFRKDVLKLFTDLAKGQFAMWIWLIVATIPVGLVGVLGKDTIEAAAGTVRAAGVGLFITATALMVGERFRRKHEANGAALDHSEEKAPPIGLALFMGCAQAVAIWPGISRSGSTISAGFVRGLGSVEAARLSFMMSLPAISGAAIVELPHALDEGFGSISPGIVLAAAAVAGLVGFAALKTLLLVLKKGSFPYFAGYCALLGTAALLLGS